MALGKNKVSVMYQEQAGPVPYESRDMYYVGLRPASTGHVIGTGGPVPYKIT